MVFGYILYEAVDIGFTMLKLSYNGIHVLYNWYYPRITKEEILIKKITMLNDRVKKIEQYMSEH